ncbi:unnamed protein product [Prorocentrum cordatum]|uniref:Uncharacterized protein n=1 Tax=Prorocentrum cordatum TaxID=2364126 RepID=A0ABN9RKU6_9DINO|nr:unnamed protein product [Polarella glacialis]
MSALDTCALGAYLVIATPRPLQSDRSLLEELEASLGVWEFALLASVALQMSLCAATWRVYKELRSTGLYPPGSNLAAVGRMREVPFMEVMCETEDMELITECISPYGDMLAPVLPVRGEPPLSPSPKAPLMECGGPATPSTALADAAGGCAREGPLAGGTPGVGSQGGPR